MSTPFGPQLIGETEKTLVALLRRYLGDSGLTEQQWVTLRVASMAGEPSDRDGLVAAVADRAHFPDAAALVDELTVRGLLGDGRPTEAGSEVLRTVLATSDANTGHIWRDLDDDDVEATTRVLNELLTRARAVLQS